jgi:hypothetical protein
MGENGKEKEKERGSQYISSVLFMIKTICRVSASMCHPACLRFMALFTYILEALGFVIFGPGPQALGSKL